MQEQKKRPSTLGLLDLNRCAKEVDTFARPLDFDLNHNPLGLPKLMIKGDFIAVGQIEVLNEWSQYPAGTITAIEPNFLKVASSSYELALGQFQTLEGQALEISDLLERFALQVGSQFERIKPETIRHMETLNSLIAEHEAFWVERLTNLQPVTIPYADKTTPPGLPKQFAKVIVPVPDEVKSCLNKNQNWNPGDFLLAAFVGYLARIGGTNSFDLGLRDELRDLELARELNQSQGFFADSVPCHLELNLEQSFAEFLTAIQEQIELTKQHKTYRRDIVVRDSKLRFIPELASSEIFPVVVDRLAPIAKPESNLGSELTMVIPDDGRQWTWLYSVEALDDESIARLVEQFTIFLQNIVQDLTQPLTQLSLLSEAEYHKVLVEWNDTTIDYPRNKCIHQLFEQQVAKTPEAIALIFEEQQLTYRELNQRADALAAYLGELGVTAEVLVGICVERSVEMVVGILAILKAGGAYVPLDSSYPLERIGYMLSDAQVAVLLTQQSLNLGELFVKFPQPQTKVIYLEQIPSTSTPENPLTLATPVNSSNLAYVIYTSGSTGKPKGVQIEHRTAVNLLRAIAQSPGIDAGDTLLSVTTISFDIAVLEIFLPLIVGAKLAIVSRQTAMDGHQLIQALEQYQATVMQSTPITWKMLLAAGWQGNKNLTMFSGGEALSKQLAQELVNKGAALWNLYGPTETTIWSSIQQVKAEQESIAIGRPIANVRYYILDPNLMPLPVGIPGELYIGGDCLARGYLNRPELTAERFIPDPFVEQVEQPTARMYKTGDLACYFADGTVNCLGRLDRQVKIRGFRIELGEIEAAIALHPQIQQTVVIVREDNPGDQRLVAYIVTRPEQTVTTEEIRRFLKPQLPGHMIPGSVVILQTFPLTLNGKIDYRSLPAPIPVRKIETNATFVAPRDPWELQLARIWEKVLGVKGISIHDNFFELGGQSLLAARLFAEVNEIFQQKLTLSTIFQAPTIEQLAKILSQTEYLPNSSYLVPIQPFGSRVPFFCIHGAQGEVLFLKSLANHLGSDQPFYALRSPGQNGEVAPLTCIEEMAKLYLEEIKTVQPQGPYFLGGYSFGGLVAFEMAQQLQKQGQEVSLLALLDCYAPGSLRRLPLVNRGLKHFRNFLAIGPDYILKKLKTLRTKSLYRLFKGETMKNNYFHHLTSTKYFYNLINEFPNYTVQDLELWENLYKANLQARANYIPSIYDGKITVFRVVIDPTEDFYQPVASCGWSELSNQAVELHNCTGDHYSFIEEPYVQDLAKKLQAYLISGNEL